MSGDNVAATREKPGAASPGHCPCDALPCRALLEAGDCRVAGDCRTRRQARQTLRGFVTGGPFSFVGSTRDPTGSHSKDDQAGSHLEYMPGLTATGALGDNGPVKETGPPRWWNTSPAPNPNSTRGDLVTSRLPKSSHNGTSKTPRRPSSVHGGRRDGASRILPTL